MISKRYFCKCEICGNIVGMIHDSGVKIFCCGHEMGCMMPNTVEASQEKHLPVVAERTGNKLVINVGSAPHPMTLEHHIAWIAIAQGSKTQRVALEKTAAPTATFFVDDGDVTMYAYCNLHGLWMAEAKQFVFNAAGENVSNNWHFLVSFCFYDPND